MNQDLEVRIGSLPLANHPVDPCSSWKSCLRHCNSPNAALGRPSTARGDCLRWCGTNVVRLGVGPHPLQVGFRTCHVNNRAQAEARFQAIDAQLRVIRRPRTARDTWSTLHVHDNCSQGIPECWAEQWLAGPLPSLDPNTRTPEHPANRSLPTKPPCGGGTPRSLCAFGTSIAFTVSPRPPGQKP